MDDPNEIFDLFIIGGGINGVGIARDAAGRGLRVGLCEQGDLAAGTSSTSSKLIHGGLRYLEHFEFRLVRESLSEREVLLRTAPHLVRPLRFVLPHTPGLRPAWMMRAGLFLYDHLSRRVSLPDSSSVDLRTDPLGSGLKPEFRRGFVYSDCQVDDARLVIANARSAAAHGARIMVHTRCTGAEARAGIWHVWLEDTDTGATMIVGARVLLNVAGPSVAHVRSAIKGVTPGRTVRLIKGSHIVVPRVHAGGHAYILQNDDARVFFVIPFEGAYSLIGTTEVEVPTPSSELQISEDEIQYLCRAAARYLEHPPRPHDVVWSFAGLRPLYGGSAGDLSAITRDYVLDLDIAERAPVITVYGGKLTTYRKLAEQVLIRLRPYLPPMKAPWTESASLPGGDLPGDTGMFVDRMRADYPALPEDLLTALVRRHGALARQVLGDASDVGSLGKHFGADLYAREVDYLIENEWARTAEDVLWRHTKSGLRLSAAERATVHEYLTQNTAAVRAQTF